MTLDQRLRQASDEVRQAVSGHEGAPITGLVGRTRSLRVVAAAAAVVLIAGAGAFALRGTEAADTPVTGSQEQTATTIHVQEQVDSPATPVVASPFDDFSALRRLEATGDLIGLKFNSIWKSTDGGETWSLFHGEPGQMIETLDVSADGAIVAIENLNDVRKGELGPDSVSNDSPRVHMYDPNSDQWRVMTLPRPDLPIEDLAPAPMDGTGTCELGGLQSWVDGTAVAFGPEIVIVGGHSVVGEGVCNESFQLLWTSPNGLDWTIVPDTGAEAYLTGLVWADDSYIGYGTPLAQFPGVDRDEATNAELSLGIFTTTDLSTWTQVPLNLAVLPENVVVDTAPPASDNSGIRMAGVVPTSDGTVAFTFPVLHRLPGPNLDLPDVEALHQWLIDSRLIAESDTTDTVQQTLEMMGVEFPLDTQEVEWLANYYLVDLEQVGRLLVEKDVGDGWDVWVSTYPFEEPDTATDGPASTTVPVDSAENVSPEFPSGTPISDEEFEALVGPSALVPGTARLVSWSELPDGTTHGLFTSRDGFEDGEEPFFCLWDYSSVNGGGGAQCAPSAEAFADLLTFGIGGSGSCGDPIGYLASVWGLPPSADIVTFELGDGSILEAKATDGIAQAFWDYDTPVSTIRFDGATPDQITYMEDFLGANQLTCAEMNASTGGG
ncbi:MAG: hypothetical protein ABFR53_01680 [Actinomycetota bacterium]